jgi:hypothetical protein
MEALPGGALALQESRDITSNCVYAALVVRLLRCDKITHCKEIEDSHRSQTRNWISGTRQI